MTAIREALQESDKLNQVREWLNSGATIRSNDLTKPVLDGDYGGLLVTLRERVEEDGRRVDALRGALAELVRLRMQWEHWLQSTGTDLPYKPGELVAAYDSARKALEDSQ